MIRLESVALKGTFVLLCVKMLWSRPLIHAEIRNLTFSEMLRKQRKHSEILYKMFPFATVYNLQSLCYYSKIVESKIKPKYQKLGVCADSAPSLSYLCFAFTVVSAALQSCFKKKNLMTFKMIPPCYFVRLLALSCDFLPRNWPIIVVFVCSSQSQDLFSLPLSRCCITGEEKSYSQQP